MGNTTDRKIMRELLDTNRAVLVALANQGSGGGQPAQGTGFKYERPTDASNVWIIDHNLGYRPAGITVVSTGGLVVEADVDYPTINRVVLSFGDVQLTGTAYLS